LLFLVVSASFAASDDPKSGGSLLVERGSELGFTIPQDEALFFEVLVDIPLVGETGLGEFKLRSGTEPYKASLFGAGEGGGDQAPRVGWAKATASGSCLNYTLKHEIRLRILPQEWPRVIYRDNQAGTENRRRELMYGIRAGKPSSLYRRDGHCQDVNCKLPEHRVQETWLKDEHHCGNCKRADHRDWRKPSVQEIPAGGVDMLSAIYLARSMVGSGLQEAKFPMLDKNRWWDVTLTLGQEKRLVTEAGTFDCRAVKLTPILPSGKQEKFKGLFGIHGSLSIWLEKSTGVPISIQGILPAGPLDVGIDLRLKRFRGTPEGFASIVD